MTTTHAIIIVLGLLIVGGAVGDGLGKIASSIDKYAMTQQVRR